MDSHLIPFLSLENLHLREETFVKKILLPKAGPWTLDLDTGGVVAMAGRRQGDPREFTLSRRSSGKTDTQKKCVQLLQIEGTLCCSRGSSLALSSLLMWLTGACQSDHCPSRPSPILDNI